jgi:glycosyltransferase involved in cell wall biosynthesis
VELRGGYMNVAISAIGKKNLKLSRHELINSIILRGHTLSRIGQDSEDDLHLDYKKYNMKFLGIPLSRSSINPWQEIKAIFKTKNVLKENEIDALIVYGIRTFPTIVLAAKFARVKNIVCIVNGSGRLFRLKGIKGFLIKVMSYPMLWLSFLLTNEILFQNPDDMKIIRNKGLLWKRNYTTINGSGVNLEEYYSNYLEKKPVFLMIGRLTGDKGVNEYVEAACKVKEKYPEALFYLVGPMDNDDSSLNIVALNRAISSGSINLVGRVDDVRPYINKCRVFVLPSYHEGTPRTVLEAMAMGRPIITTDAPGCRETVIDGENGFKVPIKNVDLLIDKMIWMIEHPKESMEMGLRSRKICEEKYDVFKVNNVIIEALKL